MNVRDHNKSSFILIFLLALFLSHTIYIWNFTVDDAYISFRYADNLANGKGLVFNEGEREEGYSNFLWILILSLFSKIGIDLVLISKLLNLVFGTGVILLTYRLSTLFKNTHNYPEDYIAPFLIVTNTSFVVWVASGMETILYTFLLLLACYLFLKDNHKKGRYLSAFFFFLLALTRPEGILFFLLALISITIKLMVESESQSNRQAFFIFGLIFFIPFIGYLTWKYLYFGTLIPNTFYAKFHNPLPLSYPSAGKFRKAIHYLTQAFLNSNLIVTIPFLGLLFRESALRKDFEKLFIIIGIICFQIGFIITVGGDWMPRDRFIVPIFPFIYLLFQEGLIYTQSKIKNFIFRTSTIITIFALSLSNFPSSKFEHFEYLKKKDGELKRIRELGIWLKKTFPQQYTVAYEEAGIPLYYSHLKLLDPLGLLNRDIAKIWYSNPQNYWNANKKIVDYILKKKPELIIVVAKRQPKEWRDFYSGIDYTFFHNKYFKNRYKLIHIKDWILPGERLQYPEGFAIFIYQRNDQIN